MGSSDSAPSLPFMNADPDTVTVSGYSAGGYMSHRHLIINSDVIQGAASFHGMPYGMTLGDLDPKN